MEHESKEDLSFIPIADLKARYLHKSDAIKNAVNRVLESGWYILGKEVTSFEKAFAAYLGVGHCIGVANGTDALAIALRACKVGPGDEVITTSHSAVATVAAIEQIGAIPVFADIEEDSLGLDPKAVERMIGKKTRAVVCVHIYGRPAKIEAISKLCRSMGLALIEDCAQSHGAEVAGNKVGTFGDIAAFSFYPTKNLGALGDGGAVVTDSAELAERASLLRQYGWKERYISASAGVNSRLDEIQAAILLVKLDSLEIDNKRRRDIARIYNKAISGSDLIGPTMPHGELHAMHLYVVRSRNREALMHHLEKCRIATALHYPAAIHQQPAYNGRVKGSNNLPITEKIYSEILTLPLFPELEDSAVRRVARALSRFTQISN